MGRTHVIHRQSVDVVCVICTFSVLIVDARPQIICESCLCCFSFLMCRTIRRDEIHRSSVDLVCLFLHPYGNFLANIHRPSVDVSKKIVTDEFRLCQLFCVVTDKICLWQKKNNKDGKLTQTTSTDCLWMTWVRPIRKGLSVCKISTVRVCMHLSSRRTRIWRKKKNIPKWVLSIWVCFLFRVFFLCQQTGWV